jgi:two-component system phosphate regulon sensor histidine kinase PhoR
MTTPFIILLSIILLISGFLLGRLLHSRRSIVNDDIGEIKKELEEAEHIKDLESYRKEFMGNVYHELKTPIFNMQGYILTLLDGALEDKAINRVYLERAEKNINRMISIVEDLESISGLESGVLNLGIEIFDIRKLIDDVFEATELKASKQNIKLELNKIKDSDLIVSGDRKRIYQVFNNLLINSINYGNKGGRTTISVLPAGDRVMVEIKDTGIGMSDMDIPRIFERFYRVDKSRSRDSGGTGLGLAIVKHIIEAHNQTVKVSSAQGKGSVFTFTLDRAY